MAYENNSFSRTRGNEAKMGAFYTDLSHCRDIGNMFIWPEEEVSVLEPSIGDAKAVIETTRKANRKIFGVELNDATADSTKQNPQVEAILKADFTNGVMIRKGCFSFCFANPPYLSEHDEDGSYRIEKVFLEKIANYLKVGGILVWIVPHSQFEELSHHKLWMKHFDTLAAYRFREEEYDKWKQVVIIGRKVRARETFFSNDVSAHIQKYHVSRLEELPYDLEPTIEVLPSPSEGVDLFACRSFDEKAAYQFLCNLGTGIPDEVNKIMERKISIPEFRESELLRPPIPPKKDSLYLLATSGSGQGFTGSEETFDLHLQRGVAEVIEETRMVDEDDEDTSNSSTMVVTSRTAITMTVVQNDGTITALT